jgi:hypothetical protein
MIAYNKIYINNAIGFHLKFSITNDHKVGSNMINKKLSHAIQVLNTLGGLESFPEGCEELQVYRPKSPIQVYRGMAFESKEEFFDKFNLEMIPKKGDKISGHLGIHWTTDASTAAIFSESPGKPFSVILVANVDPEIIFVEFSCLPDELYELLDHPSEEEVILFNRKIQASIYSVIDYSKYFKR